MSLLKGDLDSCHGKWKGWLNYQGKAACEQLTELISFVEKSFELQTLKHGIDSKLTFNISAAKKANVPFLKRQFLALDHKIVDGFIHYIPFKLQPFSQELEQQMVTLRLQYEQLKETRRQEKLKQDLKLKKQLENNADFMKFIKNRSKAVMPNFTPSPPCAEEVVQTQPKESSYKTLLNEKPTLLLCNQPGPDSQAEGRNGGQPKPPSTTQDEQRAKFRASRRLFDRD